MRHSDWDIFVKEIIGRYKKTLVTHQEFQNDIINIIHHSDSPINGLVYKVECQKPFDDFKLGIESKGESKHHNTYSLENNQNCVIKLWFEPPIGFSKTEEVMLELFNAFWRSSLRASPSGLISIKDFKDAKDCAQNKIDEMIDQKKISSVLFCDLDNFKTVNDKRGELTGDRVIREVACLLERVVKDVAIPLNNGGDEFVIFYPNASPEEALLLAYSIKKEINQHDFKIDDIPIDVSIGIAINDIENTKNFSELLKDSEKALKKEVKEKIKGLARFFINKKKEFNKKNNIQEHLKLAFCISKSNLLSHKLYNNVWLNALSMFVLRKTKNDLSEKNIEDIKYFVDWANFKYNSELIKTCFVFAQEIDFEPEVSKLDIALAISHGLMGSILSNSSLTKNIDEETRLSIRFDKDYYNVALILSPDKLIWSLGENKGTMGIFDLGSIQPFREGITSESLRIALLIKIGHKELDLPENLFSEIIVADDRPQRGGGVPDMWEATIARLIGNLSKNPNISSIFVIGEKAYGARTIEQLKDAPKWDPYFIYRKTGMPIQAILESSKRLKDSVIIAEKKEEIVTRLTSLLQEHYILLPVNQTSIIDQRQRTLKRPVDLESMALTKEDGCRVGTIREAFPVMLEIARHLSNKEVIKDQAGRELHELVDFKVHLIDPLRDKVPDFYAEDEKSLADYFEKQFINETGLFGGVFRETGQLEAVIDHIVKAISHPTNPFATRRAILVVPHKPEPGQELTPLGLVSIRCVPRLTEKKITLNYSYTWRSVEAFVGFPYSIYGSVRYSEFLTEKIREKLPPMFQKKVEMGFISYVAYSLHIFIDEYGQNIAKRIVDDASI